MNREKTISSIAPYSNKFSMKLFVITDPVVLLYSEISGDKPSTPFDFKAVKSFVSSTSMNKNSSTQPESFGPRQTLSLAMYPAA